MSKLTDKMMPSISRDHWKPSMEISWNIPLDSAYLCLAWIEVSQSLTDLSLFLVPLLHDLDVFAVVKFEMLLTIFELFERLNSVHLVQIFVGQNSHSFGDGLVYIGQNLTNKVRNFIIKLRQGSISILLNLIKISVIIWVFFLLSKDCNTIKIMTLSKSRSR